MRRILSVFLVVLYGSLLSAQDVEVKAWIDSSRIYIGDQVYYNIQVDQPAGLKLSLDREVDTLVDLVKIISATTPDTIQYGDDRIKVSLRYLITSFDSGSYDIPPFYAEIYSGGDTIRFYSDYVHLDVFRTGIALSDTTDVIFDIIAPLREKITAGELLPWIFLAIFIAAVTLFVIKRVMAARSKDATGEKNSIPVEPIHIMILRELDKLERHRLWQKGEIKEFYSRLTEILRRFIEIKYTVSSLEMTTSETLDALEVQGVERDENYNRLKDILTTADLSKFAKYLPGALVNEGMIEIARLYVRTSCKAYEQNEVPEDGTYAGRKEETNG